MPVAKLRSVTVEVPSEHQEQRALAAWLDERGVEWAHVPNEGMGRTREQGARLKAEGVKPGVSDNLIFTPPPGRVHGTALELKRSDRKRGPTKGQIRFLKAMKRLGWQVAVRYSAKDSIAWLTKLGY